MTVAGSPCSPISIGDRRRAISNHRRRTWLLAGGALAAAWRDTGTGGAVCGVVLLLAGVVGGYIAVTAVQLQALRGARTSVAVHAALV